MAKFNFQQCDIQGLWLVTPFFAEDLRGAFIKDWSDEAFASAGIDHQLKETFYTLSHRGVIRAIHFQREFQQPKLMRCISGRIVDCVVDLRPSSPTYMQHRLFDLSGDNLTELLVPGGCGHGYLVIEESIVSYKCSEGFHPEYDDGILWDDPDLAVDWPLDLIGGQDNLILADKDRALQSFKDFTKRYGGLA